MADDNATAARYRELTGGWAVVARTLLVLLTALGITWAVEAPGRLGFAIFIEQYLATFLGIALAAVFLLIPARMPGSDRPTWYDLVLSATSIAVSAYVAILYPIISYSLLDLSTERVVVATVGLLVIMEAVRRTFGWALVIIAVVLCAYAGYSYLFPGLFYGRGASLPRIATYVYFDANGVFGIALNVVAIIIIAYIFFGVCLAMVGGELFFTDLASAAMGRRRGGAAKISILSSILFGTISGSAVANVVVGGSITIGMMKRNGYPPHVAAAIEAASSTGGQIMPPVMGITAFILAENLEIPYAQVALAALIPALLYYLSMFMQADFEAAKNNLRGAPVSELPRARDVMRRGWIFLVPLAVLVYMLIVENYPAGISGVVAALSAMLAATLHGTDHWRPRNLLALFERTGRGMMDIVIVAALAGIVIGALNLSGIMFKMTLILSSISFGYPVILLAIVAVICIVLGMGLPTAVIYILLAVLVGPALVDLKIDALSAHLFIFYFGMLSMITPPVCMATFAAASIAGSDLWKSGWAGMRVGIAAYIVPFVFAFNPALLMKGAWLDIVIATAAATAGMIVLTGGVAGYFGGDVRRWERVALFAAGIVIMVVPSATAMAWTVYLAGWCVAAAVILLVQLRQRRLVQSPS